VARKAGFQDLSAAKVISRHSKERKVVSNTLQHRHYHFQAELVLDRNRSPISGVLELIR
jgi:hypothetical protein